MSTVYSRNFESAQANRQQVSGTVDMSLDLGRLNDKELIELYPTLIKELKKRGVIRTKNIVGELTEFIVLRHYVSTPGLPKIQHAPPGTKNVDAISINGERYAIKGSSTKLTGTFSSVPITEDGVIYFEYLVTVWFDDEYRVLQILECDWATFMQYRTLKRPENKWAISKSIKYVNACKVLFDVQ